MKWKVKWCDPIVTKSSSQTSNPTPQRQPPTMVRSFFVQNSQQPSTLVKTIKLPSLQAPGLSSSLFPNIQHRELNNNINNAKNNNNPNEANKTNNNSLVQKQGMKNVVKLAPPFSFHYTIEDSGHQQLNLELRSICERYKRSKANFHQHDFHKSNQLNQTHSRANHNHHQITRPGSQKCKRPSSHFQETLPNQITKEGISHQPTKSKSPQKPVPKIQPRKGTSHQESNMPSQASWERNDRFSKSCVNSPNNQHTTTSYDNGLNQQQLSASQVTKPNHQQRSTRRDKFKPNIQTPNYHSALFIPNQTNWEEENGNENCLRPKPPRRLPTISEVPKSKLPRLNYSSLSSQSSQSSQNDQGEITSKNANPTREREANWIDKEKPKQKKTRSEDDNGERPSKVETWRQMFLERHSHPHRCQQDHGFHANNHPHVPHHPQDNLETPAIHAPCGPLNPLAFNAGYDERRRKRSREVRVRFAGNGNDKVDCPSRIVGFSQGLQNGLRRRIERMVRKPASHKCSENPDFKEKVNCDERRNCGEGHFEEGSKPRTAWPTPCRLKKSKVSPQKCFPKHT